MENKVVQEFILKVDNAINNSVFVKLSLSKPCNKESTLKNVYVKPVLIKGNLLLSCLFRYPTRDEVKNHSKEQLLLFLENWLGNDFLNGDLFTTKGDCSILFNKKRKPRIYNKKASILDEPNLSHDKEKKRFIDPSQNLYLKEMGICSDGGKVLKSGQRKFKQINKYIEIMDGLLGQDVAGKTIKVVDMGSGKGYLTFALYDYLKNEKKMNPMIWGIELREGLVEFCNGLAQECNFENLKFIATDIHDFEVENLDILIALHACDTATDIAIAKGINAQANTIVVAPCCHKQVRKDMEGSADLNPVLKHGILKERQAEIVTDGIRALLMESKGYMSKVFEFISLEHTSKNLMIIGQQGGDAAIGVEPKIKALKEMYGVKRHYLEEILAKT